MVMSRDKWRLIAIGLIVALVGAVIFIELVVKTKGLPSGVEQDSLLHTIRWMSNTERTRHLADLHNVPMDAEDLIPFVRGAEFRAAGYDVTQLTLNTVHDILKKWTEQSLDLSVEFNRLAGGPESREFVYVDGIMTLLYHYPISNIFGAQVSLGEGNEFYYTFAGQGTEQLLRNFWSVRNYINTVQYYDQQTNFDWLVEWGN
jgi:hypothetical protein